MNGLRIAKRYAEALFGMAKEQGTTEAALSDLTLARQALDAERAAFPILDHPEISERDKRGLVENILRDVQWAPSRNFVALLIVRGHRQLLPAIIEEFRTIMEEEAGILPVEVTAAAPLTEDQTARLTRALSRMSGKTIRLGVTVDPQVLAGMLIRMRDRTIDGTARGRLEDMRSHLAELELRRSA